MRFARNRDGMFLHRFQQRRLRFGRCAVDFIRQHNGCKKRSLAETEFVARFCFDDDVRAGNIGRHQVGRKLNAARRETEHARERDRERRLADTRAVLEQNVTACVNRHQDLLDDLILADKRAVYLGNNLF